MSDISTINDDSPDAGMHMDAGAKALYLTWIAELAHEINNPNNVANASAQRLDQRLKELQRFIEGMLADDTDIEIKRAFDQRFKALFAQTQLMQAGCQRVAGIIQNMRLQAKGEQLDYQALDPSILLHSACRMAFATDSGNITLDCSALLPQGEVLANPDQLGQVFLNLLVNARHAIEAKQASHAEWAGVVQCGCRRRDGGVELFIRDNGCGMPEDVLGRLFESYFTTKPEDQGSGLGMGISKAIVAELGGRIDVASQDGEGTEVWVWLPLAP